MNATPEKQPDQIQDNLNSMQKWLESLKASIEKDVTIATNKECVSLMKNIISTMALVRSDNAEILTLKDALDKNPDISQDVLDKIIAQFIDIQLDYTANKSQTTTDNAIDKYNSLLNHKSWLDALLSSINTSSYTIQDPVEQEPEVDDQKDPLLQEPTTEDEKSWLQRQTAALFSKEEWKKDWKTNSIRAVSWLAIVWWAAWGIKKLWSWFSSWDKEKESSDKKDDSKEGMARWKKWLLALWGIGVWRWLWKNKDKIMEWLGIKDVVSFEDSFVNFKSDIQWSQMESHFKINADAKYEKKNDDSAVLTSYGSSINLDLKNKKVQWLDVTFENYTEMLHAANIINFCGSAFRWKCSNDAPFKWSKLWWDFEVDLLEDSDNEVVSGQWIPIWKILGWSTAVLTTIAWLMYWWGAWGLAWLWVGAAAVGAWHLADTSDTLSAICPTLNKEVNKEKFRARLNKLPNLTAGKQEVYPGQTSNQKINDVVAKVKDSIENTVDENDEFNTDRWAERLMTLKNLPWHPNVFELDSWNRKVYLKIDTDASGNIHQVLLEDSWIVFSDNGDGSNALEQAIRVGLFVSQSIATLQWKWDTSKPFEYRDGALVSSLDKEGIYFDESWSAFDYKLSQKAIQENMPILLDWKNIDTFVGWLNGMKNNSGQSLWNSKKWGSRQNTYLESLSK